MTNDPSWINHLGIAALIGIVPFIGIVCTSFAKVAIVLGITRNALGVPGTPSPAIITGLAVVMSIFIMSPVAMDIADSVQLTNSGKSSLGIEEARSIYRSASPPLMDFLKRNTPPSEVAYFTDLAGLPSNGDPEFRVLMMAFVSNELVEAFLIGFLIFLPFVVIDLITANTLAALGLQTMPPAAVSVPLKLLLFVVADGWHLLATGLIASYGQ